MVERLGNALFAFWGRLRGGVGIAERVARESAGRSVITTAPRALKKIDFQGAPTTQTHVLYYSRSCKRDALLH